MEKEETLNLIKAAQGGDKSASEQLLTLNSPLIKSVIRRYKNKGVEYDDLYSAIDKLSATQKRALIAFLKCL